VQLQKHNPTIDYNFSEVINFLKFIMKFKFSTIILKVYTSHTRNFKNKQDDAEHDFSNNFKIMP